jgi:Domain of unknown function (DUF4412)
MKNPLNCILLVLLCLNLPAYAQMGPATGPQFGGPMDKLFGAHQSFSATLDMRMKVGDNGSPVDVPGQIAVDSGKSRFEMNMSEMKGHQMSPEAAAHMKAMGMDKMVSISLPAEKTVYLIYPDMKAYVEMPIPNADEGATNDLTMQTTELGKETVDGHACVKNKVVMTYKDGNRHECTVWNATDLNKFPIKIVQDEEGHQVTMLFKDIKFSKPDANLFKPPTDYTKYDNMQTMIREQIMKRMGGMGMPAPGQQ